ncbi:MAG: hydrolase [Pseudomonadota bacterium]
MRRVASEIASTSQIKETRPTDLSRAMVEMQQHAIQTKTSMKALQSADKALGTLFDEHV